MKTVAAGTRRPMITTDAERQGGGMVRDIAMSTTKDTGSSAPVFLASRSPRRRELLDKHGIKHTAAHPGFDDAILEPGRCTPRQWVAALAYLKASAGLSKAGHGPIVLGADTLCVKDGVMLGTPHSAQEASSILRSLSGGTHEVLTGVALIDTTTGRRHVFVDQARVHMGPLTEAMIESYVATGQWQGKAGGYNLRERLDAGWPITFEGDEGTIMGLPMRKLGDRLNALRAAGATGPM